MGIRFQCPNGHKLNVKADLAGKRASCPECGVKLVIPAASAEPVTAPAAIVVNPAPPPSGVWYLRTTGGEQFGPASEAQLSSWIVGGRVTADSHVWRDGWPEWKLARDAADTLPVPLAAVPVAGSESVVLPVVPETIVPEPIVPELIIPDPIVPNLTPQSVVALGLEADVDSTEPAILDAVAADVPPAALNYAVQRRRGKKTQLTLAIVMLLAVIVLAGVLIWVIMYNATAAPPVSRAAPQLPAANA